MKQIFLLAMMCLTIGLSGQELIRTSTDENYQVDPTLQGEVNFVLESISFNYLANNGDGSIIVTYLEGNTEYGADTVYRYIDRGGFSKILANIEANPTYGATVDAIKTAAINLMLNQANSNSYYDHNAWVADSILYDVVR